MTLLMAVASIMDAVIPGDIVHVLNEATGGLRESRLANILRKLT